MALPLFFPPVRYVKTIDRKNAIPLDSLCDLARTRCEAFGSWTQRLIVMHDAEGREPWLLAEPGDWGAVEIGVPSLGSTVAKARWALGALAFVLFDGVARATLQGKEWARIERPRGRPSHGGRALTNAERQHRFRSKTR